MFIILPASVMAAPYAAMVMDARTGEVLHSRNADTRLHPASLTKMMTLYVAFQAIERGEITLDTKVKVSRFAASEPPSKLGLQPGQRIALRYLIRAAAVKSANDAATAIGEAISGSEAAFARRMNRTAKSLGMTRTTFKNAHGLTESGHMSTARDMTLLGRHVLYDYPQYYNLFSRRSTHAGVREVANTNRRLLANYRGADGIKTGYTRAAGFNLVASAERGNERVIATVFGGKSTASRNARVAELLDMGFRRAPSRAPLRKPQKPNYVPGDDPVVVAGNSDAPQGAGKIIRLTGAVKTSLRPQLRPGATQEPVLIAANEAPAAAVKEDDILTALQVAQAAAPAPVAKPKPVVIPMKRPAARPGNVVLASVEPEVVTRLSTSGGRHWGVNVGRYPSRYKAEKILLQTALTEMSSLDGSLRKVVRKPQGFDANFMGMTREGADLACRRLQARNITCFTIGPQS
ncbi:MAG: D-alanyl-D-alanine carboxypeptidase family protein [Pseudomonadota bacterium]